MANPLIPKLAQKMVAQRPEPVYLKRGDQNLGVATPHIVRGLRLLSPQARMHR